LDDTIKGEILCGRSIVAKRFLPGNAPGACHVLFVSRSEKSRLAELLNDLKKKPILTVGDLDQFCQKGGMINLILSSDGTVKPEINPDADRLSGVQISSKLLHLPMVRIVKTER
jgi:hypothetical protein